MTSRSSTERLGDFSESVVFHVVSWVSFGLCWFGFGWVVLLFLCLCCFEDTSFFALTFSPTCGNSQSKTKRFDDRLSLERARHELKKFLQSLRLRVNGVYPPLALVEAFITDDNSTPRVRRLHLIVVDLNRRRRLATRVSRQLSKINVDECAAQCWNTLPIPWKQDQETYELRYVFGYAMDGTDLPCYILWPIRTEDHSFWCLDAWKEDWVQLDKCGFIAPVGIEHFFDAALAHNDPGEQQQVKLWVFLLAILRRILI